MKMSEILVIDTSIIFSVLISNNRKIRDILADKNTLLVSPKFVIVELFKHSERIQRLAKLDQDDVLELLFVIISRIKFYEDDLISIGSWSQAWKFCREIDENDTPFVALALELDAKLWTFDVVLSKGLVKMGFNNFYSF
jgi:predicted nucleic acid-binding protein